ncbi:MAG: hypothetical protein AAF208_10950 [Cyanobacteria bacterium P01_A01_bin.45]
MKDNISLIAAAAGGLILSVAISGIISGASVSSLHHQSQVTPVNLNYSHQFAKGKNSGGKLDNR